MPEQGGSPQGTESQEQDQRSLMERLQAGEVVKIERNDFEPSLNEIRTALMQRNGMQREARVEPGSPQSATSRIEEGRKKARNAKRQALAAYYAKQYFVQMTPFDQISQDEWKVNSNDCKAGDIVDGVQLTIIAVYAGNNMTRIPLTFKCGMYIYTFPNTTTRMRGEFLDTRANNAARAVSMSQEGVDKYIAQTAQSMAHAFHAGAPGLRQQGWDKLRN